jgi:hypothetical protein
MARLKQCPPWGVGDGGPGDRWCRSNTTYFTMDRVYLSSSLFNGTSYGTSWKVTFRTGFAEVEEKKGVEWAGGGEKRDWLLKIRKGYADGGNRWLTPQKARGFEMAAGGSVAAVLTGAQAGVPVLPMGLLEGGDSRMRVRSSLEPLGSFVPDSSLAPKSASDSAFRRGTRTTGTHS